MKIPLVDLSRQNRIFRQPLVRIFADRLKTTDFIDGKDVSEFELAFARFCQNQYCVGVNSGTDALFFALLSLNIGPGDEVITAPNTFFATAEAIHATGAKVVFADVEPITCTLDPKRISQKITSRTRAIIPVHLYGQPADMDPILQLSRRHKQIAVIEDCCQAHGAQYGKKVVPVSGVGAYSFYPGKNLGAFGDAGALVTDDRRIFNNVKKLRNHGSVKKYDHKIFGYNSRLDTLQAGILLFKLLHLTEWNGKRRAVATIYTKSLSGTPQITLPREVEGRLHVYHQYAVRIEKRDLLAKHLRNCGIQTGIHYPKALHLAGPFKIYGYKKGDFPVAERIAETTLSLPMFPELLPREISYIVTAIKSFFDQ